MQTQAEVIKIEPLSKDTRSITLKAIQKLEFLPGQYIMINVPVNGSFERRAYSLASNKHIELCANDTKGIGSSYLFGLKVGDKISIDGPYGTFNLTGKSGDKIFVATGTGVAPLRAMIIDLLEKGAKEKIYLFFGERTEEDMIYKSEFDKLADKHKNFIYVPSLSRPVNGWSGEKGHVQDAITKYLNKDVQEAYICGMKAMVDEVSIILQKAGISIITEKYG